MNREKSLNGTLSAYDLWAAEEFSCIEEKLEQVFVDVETDCPYGLPQQAVFHQAFFAPLEEHVVGLFLAAGYRRNGNCLYTMRCPHCTACQPIRLQVEQFSPSRSQKRNRKKNDDIAASFLPLVRSQEHLDLCDRFLQNRYPSDNSAERYYADFFENGLTHTEQLEFRQGGRLLGNAIVDHGEHWLNAVYFFFDPEESGRGLGTYNVLRLIDFCRERGIIYLYLGFYIRDVQAMNYKDTFRPYQLLEDGVWCSYSGASSRDLSRK
ncbi:arginyltransferase [Desulfotalea psychrophila]|uniref:Aspartate/glutamate leucyltransferase n=1 Tax=Desulfotalea psychrophila (strain LSv54 / DSM 12343) TaxID=177439 RepID=Q6AJB2_DESPS|nr:arginyltransferase [Desulfotalea psychrophila]CAG37568.1 conserved hypothetical protein [Desulfotalea psychrophila LSv54]